MKKKTLFGILIASFALFMQSCDSDFNEIGSGIFGDDGFEFETYNVQNLNTSMVNTGEVSTRNLPINNLGVYNDPVFGKTIAHFVTQVEMLNGSEFTAIKSNPVIDSVYIYIPYNTTVDNRDSEGNTIYNINNVYGEESFTLNVYENGYYLRNFDPNNNLEIQEYYSSDKPYFDSNKMGLNGNQRLNNSSNPNQNTNFRVNKDEIKLYQYNKEGEIKKDANGNSIVKERKRPGIWLDLDKAYFQNRFFANNQNKNIINNGILKEYFKGLYFNAEANGAQNLLTQLELSKGELVIVYKEDKSSSDSTRERKELKLRIGYTISEDKGSTATTVNLFENTNYTNYTNALTTPTENPLWIKGNNGSIATISLFGTNQNSNGIPNELEQLRKNKWLINQAVLTVYVDKTLQTNNVNIQPNRLYLYDVKNNTSLIDYNIDTSTNPEKNIYNGILDAKSEGDFIKYRFRITAHINNLIKNDSTNLVLGLAVTSDISAIGFNKLKTAKNSFNTNITKIPNGSTTSPFGTVLYGSNHSDTKTRMKLDIYYTKQNK